MDGPSPRSYLFVPAIDGRKLDKALDSGADCLLIDLEDSVAAGAKAEARETARQFLAAHVGDGERPRLYVRVNDLGTGLTADDLAAVLPLAEGIMLPKANSGADVQTLASMIEAAGGRDADDIGIIAIATETPLALLQMSSFVDAHPRLEGLTWGAEDLGTAIGASSARDASGAFTGPFALARNLALIAAHAAGVQAIDSIYADFRDEAGLAREAADAARDGFSAKMAIHPGQIAAINAAFAPSPEAIAEASAIVAAFDANPGAGVVGLDGRMVDRPHLLRAQKVLARLR
ncbi:MULTISPECIES: CoA ester lyase [Rhodomicrobium]|uniref:HpcH/HpaI aldolase/citrate lyase family protein n=1 Tax=Rhodomicrobium TaxID=1068 RepID=UPI000B4C16CB|nr:MULTISPECIES: CoA ester lyase [Rhodomicrobium]